MYLRLSFIILLNTKFLFSTFSQDISDNQIPKNKWREIDSLMNLGLVKTAEPKILHIFEQAKEKKDLSDYIKAFIYKIEISKVDDDFDINKLVDQINNEIKETIPPQKQILHSILAELYANYFKKNIWKIKDRTNYSFETPEDINNWTKYDYQDKIKKHFLLSIENKELLGTIQTEKLQDILSGDNKTRDLKPTLFDFLTHRLITHFSEPILWDDNICSISDENLKYFYTSQKFIDLKIDTIQYNEPIFFVLQCYQELLSFHQNDKDKTAFIVIDQERLAFVKNHFLSEEKYELNYLNSLNNIIISFPEHPLISEVKYEKARIYTLQGNRYNPFNAKEYQWEFKKAAKICESVINDFPETLGAKYCKEMLTKLKSLYANVELNTVQLPETSILASLTYKNCPKIYFRIVRLNLNQELKLSESQRLNERLSSYLVKPITEEWMQVVPDIGDLQQHSLQIRLPELKTGYYVLLASSSPKFKKEDLLHSNYFFVSGLSFISREDGQSGTDILVLNRADGIPMKNIKLEISSIEYNYQKRQYSYELEQTNFSDKHGLIHLNMDTLKGKKRLQFTHENDTLIEALNFFNYERISGQEALINTHFFTDRKIYRPGQIVYFKGIIVMEQKEKANVVPNKTTKVVFFDVNQQEIFSQTFTSNEFGSFHGSFVIPKNLLSGDMYIQNESGNIYFSVEEYKRPNFEIIFDTIITQYRLNDSINVSGIVKTFSGSTLDNINIRYYISRSESPYFKDDNILYKNEEKPIQSGNTTTNDKGAFNISFLAKSEQDLISDPSQVHFFHVKIEATDLNGETQLFEKNIPVSNIHLEIIHEMPEFFEKNNNRMISLSAVNLNGQKQKVNISIGIFKLLTPEKAYQQRHWKRPDQFVMDKETFYSYFPDHQYDNERDKTNWDVEYQVYQAEISTDEVEGFIINNLSEWENGIYKLVLNSSDQYGEEIETIHYFTLYSAEQTKLPWPDFNWFSLSKNTAVPNDTCYFVIGSFAENVSVLYELQHKNNVLLNKRFKLNNEQKKIIIPITKDHIGELNINIVFVKNNEIYTHTKIISVNNPDKKLKISLETFRPVLTPGQDEEWKIKIRGNNNDIVSSELMCSMTDISLENFRENYWNFYFNHYEDNRINWHTKKGFVRTMGRTLNNKYYDSYFSGINPYYENFSLNIFNQMNQNLYMGIEKIPLKTLLAEENIEFDLEVASSISGEDDIVVEDNKLTWLDDIPQFDKQNAGVNIRKNLNETAFFYPDLQTNKSGDIIFKFKSPETLTRWKFMALAHTKDLKTDFFKQEIITQKALMLNANIPRFFRQGDTVCFSTNISNLTEKELKGNIHLQLFDAENSKKLNLLLSDHNEQQNFNIAAKSSINKDWKIFIPDNVSALMYKLVAVSDEHSDGEERLITVLSNRILITESLPIHLNSKETKLLSFEKLLKSDNLKSIKHNKLKLEITSNPNWYAIQALTYVAESSNENSIGLFNRFYANAMSKHILNSNPKIKQIFNKWKAEDSNTFLSKLEKDQELKSVLLSETPWLIDAKDETERKYRLALFFDLNTMEKELNSNITKLLNLQLPNGAWSWYKEGMDNRYITQYILCGILHLKHFGILKSNLWDEIEESMMKAIHYLNKELKEDYEKIKEDENIHLEEDHLQNIQIQYLFALSHLDEPFGTDESMQNVIAYYLDQLQKYWMKHNNYLQAMIALTLSRYGDSDVANLIIKSLKERSSYSEEMGIFWKQEETFYWYQEPIATQASLIEAFFELDGDKKLIFEMKKWLIKQKQTQLWNTAKASVEAINALLLGDENVFTISEPIQIKLGNEEVKINEWEAGTGYYEKNWNGSEVEADMGNIQLKNKNQKIIWGALHWMYLEDIDKITSHQTPLSIKKQLFVKETINGITSFIPLDEKRLLKIGDKIISQIVIRVDRKMEFVHLKDMRASAFEPRHVLSNYQYQNGLFYYHSTKDAATHFYFDWLNKGTYVLEYEMIVSQKGNFSNGITSIQCMYAPEFSGHSEGIRVKVE